MTLDPSKIISLTSPTILYVVVMASLEDCINIAARFSSVAARVLYIWTIGHDWSLLYQFLYLNKSNQGGVIKKKVPRGLVFSCPVFFICGVVYSITLLIDI